ncbi:penicillin acylase family protein [Aquiflexum gelatinilyticum]|uniref:penicillin acylase family protein n=1 Tax=Aquiflexum gelatinilyticum TaxID=2961943 RepID=UPI0021671BF6|nr:penicillin acylase family protein [Aquiflexum gelatinilyticum]MCS4433126.1 penicillin acylase family protein [Aquiflexum gelatinilyticum]
MRYLGFILVFLITMGLGISLSMQFGTIPPIGKLLDPNHGFWQNSYSEDMDFEDELDLNNLSKPVKVIYDENLIPHVFAENDKDLYRVQGFITAKHRLWEMEFQTMAAAGRISEIVGPIAIELDRMTRRKGLAFAAENSLQFIQKEHPDTYELLEAYADGVNQYIESLSAGELPIEYKILDYKPEMWSAYKSLLLLKYMADMLVGDRDLEYTNLRNQIGQEMLDKLYPDFPEENDPVIEAERIWDFVPLEIKKPVDKRYPDEDVFVNTLPQPVEGIGSNNWAVSGSKTKSGNPILANDPHLSLNLPSLWYVMQLSTPAQSVKGATLPGALGIISGFNENIAWGVTNATRDTRDWYAIQFKDERREEYLYDEVWVKSTFRVEEIKVKGQSSFLDTVVYTHHGPVVYDKNFRSDRKDVNFSLKWTAHLESNEQKTFLLLNKGKNHGDYIEALNHYTSPAQNFVFASKDGDIAMKVQGRFPLKWEGQGKFLMDGKNPDFEWQGFIPNEHNPSTLNPVRGFVSSANQHPVDPSYPYYTFDHSFEHYRNRRLNDRLKEMNQITSKDMMALQFDNFHLHASEALPVMLGLLDSTDLTQMDEFGTKYLNQLKKWNFNAFPNQEEPTLFQVWWENLYQGIWSKLKTDGIPIVLPNKYQTTKLLLNEPENEIFNNPETPERETARSLLRSSFYEMVEKIKEIEKAEKDYTWANYKKTSILHLVPNFRSFSHTNVYTGGGAGILNATSERHGASWRMIVEMGKGGSAFGIYPGGQSGNPGSKYYDNLIKKWANGEYVDVSIKSEENFSNPLFCTLFKN